MAVIICLLPQIILEKIISKCIFNASDGRQMSQSFFSFSTKLNIFTAAQQRNMKVILHQKMTLTLVSDLLYLTQTTEALNSAQIEFIWI